MARTKQTARKFTGGKAPRKTVASTAARYQPGKRTSISRNSSHYSNENTEETNEVSLIPVCYDVTVENSFYAHYFKPSSYGKQIDEEGIFIPKFSLYKTEEENDKGKEEYWMGVNFTSKFDGKGLDKANRPALNFVIVLDISGSMSLPFSGGNASKLSSAKESILALTNQLRDDDYFSFIVFDTKTDIIIPVTEWGKLDEINVAKTIQKLKVRGGTNISNGLQKGQEVLRNVPEGENRYSRICILTDMEATGDADEINFITNVKEYSREGIYTTIIGIGMDLQKNTVQECSKTPGCNYCNVQSDEDFRNLMETEFSFLVTPIAFNVSLELDNTCKWEIISGYGSPEISDIPLTTIKFSSIFPSSVDELSKGLRSGCYVFKIKSKEHDTVDLQPLKVKISWENASGICLQSLEDIPFINDIYSISSNYTDLRENVIGLRKSVVLIQYTAFIENIIKEYNTYISFINQGNKSSPPFKKQKIDNNKVESISPVKPSLNSIEEYITKYKREKELLQDDTLRAELEILEKMKNLVKELPNSTTPE